MRRRIDNGKPSRGQAKRLPGDILARKCVLDRLLRHSIAGESTLVRADIEPARSRVRPSDRPNGAKRDGLKYSDASLADAN